MSETMDKLNAKAIFQYYTHDETIELTSNRL